MVVHLPVYDFLRLLGHDGSDVVWPELPEPFRRRAFHIQEMIWVCWKLGHAVTPHEALPQMQGNATATPVEIVMPVEPTDRLHSMMRESTGVLTGHTLGGQPHAVAWDREVCLDPGGRTISPSEFKIECFWAVSNR